MTKTVEKRERVHEKTPEGAMALSYARYDSPVGPLMAVSRGRALLAISFTDNPAAMKGGLGAGLSLYEVRNPYQPISPLARLFRLLDEYFAGHAVDFSPLEVQPPGTAFDRKVWKTLQAIPHGEVRSYAEVAASVGSPRAFRAVAGACARNRLPIIIPCHRVVRSDGGLGGWSGGGGPPVKKMLLDIEGARHRR